MTTLQAIAAAKDWVCAQAAKMPGYCGAYLSGSVLERSADEIWPQDSDVDVVVVFDGELPDKIGKFRRQGVLLEITLMMKDVFTDDAHVLSTHYLAFALNGGWVLDDPQGFLVPLAKRVQAAYMQPEWLMKRVESAGAIAYNHISALGNRAAEENIFMSCGFGPSAIALPILAAAGCNCTVRKRIPKAKNVLRKYGYADFCERLDEVIGCKGLMRADLLPHMEALERTYSIAMNTTGPSKDYPFRSDIRPDAWDVAIGGTYGMLMSDAPGDAVFWMIATFARCMVILHMDDIPAYEACLPGMRAFAKTLGVGDAEAIAERRELAYRVREEAMNIARKIADTAAINNKG